METSVSAVVKKEIPLDDLETQKETGVHEENQGTKETTESQGVDKPQETIKEEELEDSEVYQFGDPNRREEIQKTFNELETTLKEMENALKVIDKPPEAMRKSQKNDEEKETNIEDNEGKETSKSEESSGLTSKTSLNVETDLAEKSPSSGSTKNMGTGEVEESKAIEVKEENKMEDEKTEEKSAVQIEEKEKDSEVVSSEDTKEKVSS